MVCTDYEPVFDRAAANGGLIENALGEPYLFQYSTTTSFQVAEFDFTSPAAAARRSRRWPTRRSATATTAGWRTSASTRRSTPRRPAAIPGTVEHNRYPRDYHCAAPSAIAAAAAAGRPLPALAAGPGAAPCAQVVWGGDPTTAWDFDGLRSAVRQALTMGLSGISTWGSDIGGFFAFFQDELTPELLTRWVQFGAVSGVMRTQADGIAVPDKPRPQVWDPDQIANWRRYAKLRTQLYPYLAAADGEYQRTGLPLMRQLALVYPDDPAAAGRDDEFLFGPDLLAAPVVEPRATERSLYLPQGRWVDLWRSAAVPRERRRAAHAAGEGASAVAGDVTVPAPLDELPLLARAGAVLPLLPAGRRHAHRLPAATRRPRSPTARIACRCSPSRAPRARAQMFDGEQIQLARARPGLGAEDQGRAPADVPAAGVAEDASDAVRAVRGERGRQAAAR